MLRIDYARTSQLSLVITACWANRNEGGQGDTQIGKTASPNSTNEYESTHMVKEIKGVCFLFSETGTEGGWWAVQDERFIAEDGFWSYEGLNCLLEDDELTVYAEDGTVLFHGIVRIDSATGAIPHQVMRKGKLTVDRSWKQQAVGGVWVHWIQKGMDPEAWGELFSGEHHGLIRREVKD